MGKKNTLLLLTAGTVVALLAHKVYPTQPRQIMVWAWKRPEALSWATDDNVRVAVLLATFSARNGDLSIDFRREPLDAAKDKVSTAVFRIEGYPETAGNIGPDIVSWISRLSAPRRFERIQIDFDARISQRGWYTTFLGQLRSTISDHTKLEATALASWCRERDSWIERLPVDEIIPMFFRMGPEGSTIKQLLSESPASFSHKCRTNLGLSIDEPFELPSGAARIFLFNPRGWKPGDRSVLDSYR